MAEVQAKVVRFVVWCPAWREKYVGDSAVEAWKSASQGQRKLSKKKTDHISLAFQGWLCSEVHSNAR